MSATGWCGCLKGFSRCFVAGILVFLGHIASVMKEHPSIMSPQPGQIIAPHLQLETADEATLVAANFWQRFVARVRSWFEVPYGYQDENGFHYGRQPAPQGFIDRDCEVMTYPTELSATTCEVSTAAPESKLQAR